MTLLILTARPDLEANCRLAEAAATAGLACTVVDMTRVVVTTTPQGPGLVFARDNLLEQQPSAVIARVGNWRPETLLAALEAASAAGVFTPNPAPAIRRARDHWRTVEALQNAGIPVPPTLVGMEPNLSARFAVDRFGLPVVVKLRRSRMGVGVMLCHRLDHLQGVLDSLWRLGDEFLVQKFITPGGSSTRAFVVDGSIVAAARFESVGSEWRSNAAQGGTATRARLTRAEQNLALTAASTLRLGICAVDLITADDGPLVCEVNPTPGFIKLEHATGVDVAAKIIRFVVGRCATPRNRDL